MFPTPFYENVTEILSCSLMLWTQVSLFLEKNSGIFSFIFEFKISLLMEKCVI